MELIHGGDITGYETLYGRRPLDFSASLNPLGMPASVRDAARLAVDDSYAYPDPLCRRFITALAGNLSLPETFLFCGNGAADVIYRLVQALRPRTALLTAPAFDEYERALRTVGCWSAFFYLDADNGFLVGENILKKITSGLDILFLCQPNNPTGRSLSPELLFGILRRCAETGTVLFIDECFCHFLDEPERHSAVRYAKDFPNLFIVDSFTKLYGMAGIRLGYGISSDADLVKKLSGAGQPWAVSTVAQAAGLAALNERGYVEESRRVLAQAKRRLIADLAKCGNVIFGAEANYVFFHSGIPNLDDKLMREGLLIRNCGNFRGLGAGYYRVSVRLEEENDVLIQAIADVGNG